MTGCLAVDASGNVTPAPEPSSLGYVLATWGGNLQTLGRHPAINGQDNATEIVSLGVQASSQVPADGTIDTITYYNSTGDATTQFQIILNGVVAYTFTTTAPYGMEGDIGVPVVAFDNVALRYIAGTAPSGGLYSMYIN